MDTRGYRADGSTPRLIACLLACLLVLGGCGSAAAVTSGAVPTPATADTTPTRPPTRDFARTPTLVAQRTPGSPVTPSSFGLPVTGPPCPPPGPPLAPMTAAPSSTPAALATPTAAGAQTFPGPCVDHQYDQPLAFAPDGRALALGGAVAVALYDPISGRALWTLPTLARPAILAFAPDSASLVIGLTDGRVLLCRAADGTVARILYRPEAASGKEERDAVAALAFSPDGRVLAVGYERFVAVWARIADGTPIVLGLGPGIVGAVAFEEGGAALLTVQPITISNQKLPNVHRWGTTDWRQTDSILVPVIATTRLTGHGPTLATVTNAGVALWALDAIPPMHRDMSAPRPFALAQSMPQLAFSPHGDLLVGGTTSGGVYLWDVTSATALAAYAGPKMAVTGVALAPDGATVAAVFADGTVYFWRR